MFSAEGSGLLGVPRHGHGARGSHRGPELPRSHALCPNVGEGGVLVLLCESFLCVAQVGAQKAVYGKGRDLPMVLAAGKTNLGHLEGRKSDPGCATCATVISTVCSFRSHGALTISSRRSCGRCWPQQSGVGPGESVSSIVRAPGFARSEGDRAFPRSFCCKRPR